MEIKVLVEGVERVVCGVTENSTCEEVVITLAQVLGRTGRYTLKEKFKEYERTVSPDERLLESLEKYGQYARDVQLTLHHLGPSLPREPLLPARAPLRQAERDGRALWGAGGGSANLAAYRQSLPPLCRLRSNVQPAPERLQRPKRMSLTLLEEARGWLENLGKAGRKQLGRDKGKGKKNDKEEEEGDVDNILVSASGALPGKDKNVRIKTESQSIISCLGGKKGRNETVAGKEEGQNRETDLRLYGLTESQERSPVPSRAEVAELRRLVVQQQVQLRELKFKIDDCNEQLGKLEMEEEKQKQQEQEKSSDSSLQPSEDEEEQIKFWLNELKAEEGLEHELQTQFLKLKEKAAECKQKFEEFKQTTQKTDLTSVRFQWLRETSFSKVSGGGLETQASGLLGDGSNKTAISRIEAKLPFVLISTHQLTDSQLTGPSELRKWCTRWTKTQKRKTSSEMNLHGAGTRV